MLRGLDSSMSARLGGDQRGVPNRASAKENDAMAPQPALVANSKGPPAIKNDAVVSESDVTRPKPTLPIASLLLASAAWPLQRLSRRQHGR